MIITTPSDSLMLCDKNQFKRPEIIEHRNFVDIFNNEGEHVLRSFNSVVNDGRRFTLDKVFNLASPLQGPNRWVSVWAAGSGGVSAIDNTQIIAVELNNSSLNDHQPFINDGTSVPPYWAGAAGQNMYKDFDNIQRHDETDEASGLLYIEFTMTIEKEEFAGKTISEIAIFNALHNTSDPSTATTKEGFSMFSHITFAGLPNTSEIANDAGDSYTIMYRIYA